MNRILKQLTRFSNRRFSRVSDKDNRYTMWLIVALFISTSITGIIEIIGNPLGISNLKTHAIGIALVIVINLILFPLITYVLASLFTFLYIPLPRLLLGSLTYALFTSIFFLHIENSGTLFSFVVGTSYTFLTLLVGVFFIFLFSDQFSKPVKIISILLVLSIIPLYNFAGTWTYEPNEMTRPGPYNELISASNPGEPGDYDYQFLTYGSGTDLHRPEFAETVNEITPSVDASHFITRWRDSRHSFWGFGPDELPVNGRAFLPEGEGPFPVFLMVHGNHTMEYLSTAGYDYLGELLASRGILTISVDEDFINYSNRLNIPNNNYELRAWMILQHINQLENMNENPDSLFYSKINLDEVALMGHSRGGQAVAMAADYQTYFPEEDIDEFMRDVTIKGIVAISPTQKKLDDPKAELHNTSYLAIHGARDADVSNFRGDHQFYRSTFSRNYDGFKSTLYMAEANHTQFNTDWGKMDLSLPRGLFLNQHQTMSGEDQRTVVKVYLGAFLEAIFHHDEEYESLFVDYRNGAQWLPETALVSKYEHASYQRIVGFNQDSYDPIDVEGFKNWEVTKPQDRSNNNHPLDALKLEWETDAVFSAYLHDYLTSRPDHLVLRLANIDSDLAAFRKAEIDVELTMKTGVSVRLPLDSFMPVPDVIETAYTPFGLFDTLFRDGKFETSWEPVFQTIELPLEAFEAENPNFLSSQVTELTLHFKSGGGKLYLEQIGMW